MAQPSNASDTLVLIVEDEEDNLSAFSAVLRRGGYAVVEARTGPEAVRAAKEHHPAIVLLDLALPGMNGLDVARLLKSQPVTAAIPLVGLTGSWLADDLETLRQAGFDGALRKPVRPEALLSEIRRVLAGEDPDE